MNQLLEKPKIDSYTVDPYSARALILNLEKQHDLDIRVYETKHYCMVCIDKEEKEDDRPSI